MKELIKLLIIIFLIISSFFIGYKFNDSLNDKKIFELENKRYKVTVTQNKDKMKIEKPTNVDVIIK